MVMDKKNALPPADYLALLKLCSKIERNVAKLYRHFGKLHDNDREIAALWYKTAAEEDNHAEQFNLAARLDGTSYTGIKVDSLRLFEALKGTEVLLKKVRKSPPSVDEALKIAVELEDRLSACHMNSLVVFNDTALGELFEAMGNNDCDHVGMLQGVLNNISANKSVPAVPS